MDSSRVRIVDDGGQSGTGCGVVDILPLVEAPHGSKGLTAIKQRKPNYVGEGVSWNNIIKMHIYHMLITSSIKGEEGYGTFMKQKPRINSVGRAFGQPT